MLTHKLPTAIKRLVFTGHKQLFEIYLRTSNFRTLSRVALKFQLFQCSTYKPTNYLHCMFPEASPCNAEKRTCYSKRITCEFDHSFTRITYCKLFLSTLFYNIGNLCRHVIRMQAARSYHTRYLDGDIHVFVRANLIVFLTPTSVGSPLSCTQCYIRVIQTLLGQIQDLTQKSQTPTMCISNAHA